MKISLLSIPKDIKKYYEVRKKVKGKIGVYVIAFTTKEEAEEEARKLGGWVVEVVDESSL
ncbi:MAG: hypothetical protein J7K87_01290 [Candidatus Aenigmarchaeota archaeon]|nr:hypothetical protein [Candidatus Aenigmarchaeota archaeon]